MQKNINKLRKLYLKLWAKVFYRKYIRPKNYKKVLKNEKEH